MTYGVYNEKKLPVMRDGTQRRPMLHIKDAVRAMMFFLNSKSDLINSEIFNIGDNVNNYSINDLVKIYKKIFKNSINIEWYGSPDQRSYFVDFKKINEVGFKTKFNAEDGINELLTIFKKKNYKLSDKNITLNWYSLLEEWNQIIDNIKYKGHILDFK